MPNEEFYCPPDVLDWYRGVGLRQRLHRVAWDERLTEWKGDRAELDAALEAPRTRGLGRQAAHVQRRRQDRDSRRAFGTCLNATLDVVPGVIAGGADLTENTGTELKDEKRQSAEAPIGRQMRYGIREHAMGGIMVGMARHGGVVPVGGTFFVFSDYMRGSVRLVRAVEVEVHLRVDARLRRPRRGRPDAPADRAARVVCGRCPSCA